MNSWTSIKISGATCLIALGQLQAGNIETSGVDVSLTPATIFSAAPAARSKTTSLYSIDDDAVSRVSQNTVSDAFDQSILRLEEQSDASVSTDAVVAKVDAPKVSQPAKVVATPQISKISTVAASAPERKVTSRPATAAGSMLFQLIFKSIIVAAMVMGLKQIIQTSKFDSQVELTA